MDKMFSLEGKVALVTGAAYGIASLWRRLFIMQALRLRSTAVHSITWIRILPTIWKYLIFGSCDVTIVGDGR